MENMCLVVFAESCAQNLFPAIRVGNFASELKSLAVDHNS